MNETAAVDPGTENVEESQAAPEKKVDEAPGQTASETTTDQAPAETAQAERPVNQDAGKVNVQSSQFSPINPGENVHQGQGNISRLMDLELPIAVELGRIRMQVKEILELGPGSVVELNKFSGEPVDVFVNNKKFAEGEVVVVDQNFGVRITALVGPDERLSNFS